MPNVLIYDLDAFSGYTGGGFFDPGPFASGLVTPNTQVVGETINYSGTPGPQIVEFQDNDPNFNDGDFTQQVTTQAITLEGINISAGTQLTPEFNYTIRPVGGTAADDITIYPIETGVNNFVGLLATDKLVPGTTYEFVDTDPGASVPYNNVVPCFTQGTAILTADGPVPIEHLKPGDLVQTASDGLQPIRWIGDRTLTRATLAAKDNLRPIRIEAGALGAGLPERCTHVSPQHRVLIRSKIAQRMFAETEVLVAAKHLVGLPGISREDTLAPVRYMHLLFDRHQIIYADGAPMESLYLGGEARKGITPEALREIYQIFPELAEHASGPLLTRARPFIPGRRARRLSERHRKNSQPLLEKAQPLHA